MLRGWPRTWRGGRLDQEHGGASRATLIDNACSQKEVSLEEVDRHPARRSSRCVQYSPLTPKPPPHLPDWPHYVSSVNVTFIACRNLVGLFHCLAVVVSRYVILIDIIIASQKV